MNDAETIQAAAKDAAAYFAKEYQGDQRWYWYYEYTTNLTTARTDKGVAWLDTQIKAVSRLINNELIPVDDLYHATAILTYMKIVHEGVL